MPASRSSSSHPDQDAPAERNTVLLLVIGGLAAISAVIAALVIFSSSEAPADKPEAAAPVRAGDQAVIVGQSDAPTKVVVYEDFASPESREFEIASRDFLRIEAAAGERAGGVPPVRRHRPAATPPRRCRRGAVSSRRVRRSRRSPSTTCSSTGSRLRGVPTPSELVTWARDTGDRRRRGVRRDGEAGRRTRRRDANAAAATAGAERPPLVLRRRHSARAPPRRSISRTGCSGSCSRRGR